MKILYSSKTSLAGVCEKMCRTVNNYYEGTHEARVLNRGPGRHKWYCRRRTHEGGMVVKRDRGELVPAYNIENKDHVSECLEWADVIHCMANVGVRYFNRPDLLTRKIWVYQWHGAQIWPFSQVWSPADYKHVRFIHIGQGWVESDPSQSRFFKPFFDKFGAIVVPNLITGDDPLHTPMPWDERNKNPRVAFAPSNRSSGAVNKKGISEVKKATCGVAFDLICGVRFEECLKRKRQAKLGIDEVVTPMYHLSGLEFLAQGTPCICSFTKQTEAILMEATGADRMPFINATPATLGVKIRSWLELSEKTKMEMGSAARGWFDEYYHPRQIMAKYISVYER